VLVAGLRFLLLEVRPLFTTPLRLAPLYEKVVAFLDTPKLELALAASLASDGLNSRSGWVGELCKILII